MDIGKKKICKLSVVYFENVSRTGKYAPIFERLEKCQYLDKSQTSIKTKEDGGLSFVHWCCEPEE